MNQLVSYLILTLPGLCLAGIALALLPRTQTALRLAILIVSFILLRDAMIPAGLWQITSSFEMRFAPNPLAIGIIAFSSAAIALSIRYLLDVPALIFLKANPTKVVLAGILGGVFVYLPVLILNRVGIMSNSLPKPSGGFQIMSLLLISLFGNFLEEVLFRGYLQDFVARNGVSRSRSIGYSAAMFSLCHVFLAFTATGVGIPILVFTLYEGLICAFLYAEFGLLSATLAHGLGIFWVATASFL